MSVPRPPRTTANAVSVKDEISSGGTVTVRFLEKKLEGQLLQALPDLSLNFCPQDEEEYVPICLSFGTYRDKPSNKVYGLYLYLKPNTSYGVAPGTCIVISNTPVDKDKGNGKEKKGDDNKGILIDFDRLCNMTKSGMAKLVWPFRAMDKVEEFKAVAKWYFIKAAESRLHEFKVHNIPYNESFGARLRTACRRIMYTRNDGADPGSEVFDDMNFALVGMKGNKRTKITSEDVAQDIQMTGKSDAPNRKTSVRNDSNAHTVAATKTKRSQADELDIEERAVKREPTVAHDGSTASNWSSDEGDEAQQTTPRYDHHKRSPYIGSAEVADSDYGDLDMIDSPSATSQVEAATPDIIRPPISSANSPSFRPASKGQDSSSPFSSPLSSMPALRPEARRCERKEKADLLQLQKKMLEEDILGKRKRVECLEHGVAYKQMKLELVNEKIKKLSKAGDESEEECG